MGDANQGITHDSFRRTASFRLDLDNIERTASGGIKVPGYLARTGIQEYQDADGATIREYRPEEEVFSEDSLASFRGAVLTDLHPASHVTPETYTRVTRGHIGEDVRREGDRVAASIYIQDAEMVRAVEDGRRRELSAGYEVAIDETPGEMPDGTRYDRVQRGIRANHVAIGPKGWGRAGPEVALRLDASGHELPPSAETYTASNDSCTKEQSDPADVGTEKGNVMKHEIRLDGVGYEVEAEQSFADAYEKVSKADAKEKEKLTAKAEELQGRVDALAAELDSAKSELEKARDPEAIQARVDARKALEERARKLSPELDMAGKNDREIMVAALEGRVEVREDASEGYIQGAFEAALAVAPEAREDGLDRARKDAAAAVNAEPEKSGIEALEEQYLQRRRDAWKRPLAVTRGE